MFLNNFGTKLAALIHGNQGGIDGYIVYDETNTARTSNTSYGPNWYASSIKLLDYSIWLRNNRCSNETTMQSKQPSPLHLKAQNFNVDQELTLQALSALAT